MRLKRFRKTNEELGEVYHHSRGGKINNSNGGVGVGNKSKGIVSDGNNGSSSKPPSAMSRQSLFSAQSRSSVLSAARNRVAPGITPVENGEREELEDGIVLAENNGGNNNTTSTQRPQSTKENLLTDNTRHTAPSPPFISVFRTRLSMCKLAMRVDIMHIGNPPLSRVYQIERKKQAPYELYLSLYVFPFSTALTLYSLSPSLPYLSFLFHQHHQHHHDLHHHLGVLCFYCGVRFVQRQQQRPRRHHLALRVPKTVSVASKALAAAWPL